MAAQAGLCLAWSETPEDRFSHDEARSVLLATILQYYHDDAMYLQILRNILRNFGTAALTPR